MSTVNEPRYRAYVIKIAAVFTGSWGHAYIAPIVDTPLCLCNCKITDLHFMNFVVLISDLAHMMMLLVLFNVSNLAATLLCYCSSKIKLRRDVNALKHIYGNLRFETFLPPNGLYVP